MDCNNLASSFVASNALDNKISDQRLSSVIIQKLSRAFVSGIILKPNPAHSSCSNDLSEAQRPVQLIFTYKTTCLKSE
jgi:hypothetical protein